MSNGFYVNGKRVAGGEAPDFDRLLGTANDMPWHREAACYDSEHPDIWFPEANTGHQAEARRECMACPVRLECLDYALERPDLVGIWGGMTDDERRMMREGEVRPCAYPGCDVELAAGRRLYCTPEHQWRDRGRRMREAS